MSSTREAELPFTPARLVEEAMSLNVPIYQRLFVWRKEQIEKLLSDLYEAYSTSPTVQYSIGVISVWKRAKDNDAEKANSLEIVDGQQRLTFLSLLSAWNVAKLEQNSDRRTKWHSFLFLDNGEKRLRLHFIGRSDDENAIKVIANQTDPQEQKGTFGHFLETIEGFFNTLGIQIASEKMEEFLDFVYEKCAFWLDFLPEGYTPYDLNLYFEKMNSTGRQLEPIDVVKGLYFSSDDFSKRWNKVFRTVGDISQTPKSIVGIIEDVDTVGSDNVQSVGDEESGSNMNDAEDASRRETRRLVSDEVLLLHTIHILNPEKKHSHDTSKLLQEFENYFGNKKEEWEKKAENFLTSLEEYSNWMDKYIVRLVKDERTGINRAVFVKGPLFNEDFATQADSASIRKLKQFESMLFVSSDDSQNWILETYLAIRNENNITAENLLEGLKKSDAQRHPLDDNQQTWTYGNIDRYWFWKLDYLLWERCEKNSSDAVFQDLNNTDKEAIKSYVFRKDRSIEHLHPQNPPTGSETSDWSTDKAEGNNTLNSFGNLAMISSPFNSTQSNDSISTKIGRIEDQVRERRLQSIKLLFMVRSVKSNPNGWTVEASKAHEEAMFGVLKGETEEGSYYETKK